LQISGQVWTDDDDGLRQPAEPQLPGVTVRLLDVGGGVIGTDTTDVLGRFEFDRVAGGDYVLDVDVPDGYRVSPADQAVPGVDPDVADDGDSDFTIVDTIAGTARTAVFTLTSEDVDDLGLGLVPEPAEPSTTSTVAASTSSTTTSTTEVRTTTQAPTSTTEAPTTTGPTTTLTPPSTTAVPTTLAATTVP
jgi:hypothetical protein